MFQGEPCNAGMVRAEVAKRPNRRRATICGYNPYPMNLTILTAMLVVVAMSATAFAAGDRYPTAPTSDIVDDYHGVKVADPYRPLEDPDAPGSREWIEAENKLTADFL